MKASKLFFQTYKEVPSEAEIKSHQLMLRAGLIRQQASGIYAYLPLGFKVLKKIEQIIREEMNRAGAQELLMPGMVPQEVYSARIEKFGSDMFKLQDRKGNDYCLTPTHEELFTLMVKDVVKSYKQLPVNLYQFQTKYRDERRPRFGLQRAREFIMKDAYSFDVSEQGLHQSYLLMYEAYVRAFNRLGLDFVAVSADSGAMGGKGSQEFMVKSEVGEDFIVFCSHCDYAANEEKATTKLEKIVVEKPLKSEKIYTPNVKTIEEVSAFLQVSPKKLVKTLLYIADKKPVMVLVRGDREVQEVKLTNILNAIEIRLASGEEVNELLHCNIGFVGPISSPVPIILDAEVAQLFNFVVGANDDNYHYKNVNISDFKVTKVADIKSAKEGDNCPVCGKPLKEMKGIEVGHIFELGTTYSDRFHLTVLDETGKEQIVYMGSYGIGLGRTMAAVIEQLSDEKGIIWSKEIAPFALTMMPVSQKDEAQVNAVEALYTELTNAGFDILLDDRNASFGSRMKDSELLGIPYVIVAGKKINDGLFEMIDRKSGEKLELTKAEITKKLIK